VVEEVRYAVQRPKAKRWETLHAGRDAAAAQAAFEEAKTRLRVVRLIRLELEDRAEGTTDWKWTLVSLHDGRGGGADARGAARRRGGRGAAGTGGRGAASGSAPDRVRVPYRLYAWVVVGGVLAGAAALVLAGG
jgi:hypothetical protein